MITEEVKQLDQQRDHLMESLIHLNLSDEESKYYWMEIAFNYNEITQQMKELI